MLPPFIIDQIRKREEDERRPLVERVLELPLPMPMPSRPHEPKPREDDAGGDRGVVIIDLI